MGHYKFAGQLIAMPIAQTHEIFSLLLRCSAEGRERTRAALRGPIADHLCLTDADRAELPPSGAPSRFVNRLCSAKIHLERAGFLARVRRGVFTISDAGRALRLGSMSSNHYAASMR